MRRTAIYTLLITLVVSSCGPEEIQETLELEGNIQTDESAAFSTESVYAPQYTCPNCGELFNGHKCENCHYTENR